MLLRRDCANGLHNVYLVYSAGLEFKWLALNKANPRWGRCRARGQRGTRLGRAWPAPPLFQREHHFREVAARAQEWELRRCGTLYL